MRSETGYRMYDSPSGMPDVGRILEWAKAVCAKCGIRIASSVSVHPKVCRRKDFYAVALRRRHNRFVIVVSERSFDDFGVDETLWRNLMLHELCHTVRGCYNHRWKWKWLVRRLNAAGYRVD